MRMVRRHRAFGLIQMVVMLPLIAAILLVGFGLTSRVIKLQGREARKMSDNARMRDVVRRIERDVNLGESVEVQQITGGELLTIRQRIGEVAYKSVNGEITRIEQEDGNIKATYGWAFEFSGLDFEIEMINGNPRLVWMKFDRRVSVDRGPDRSRVVSAAATIGRGGGS